jgi:hypothetical protein
MCNFGSRDPRANHAHVPAFAENRFDHVGYAPGISATCNCDCTAPFYLHIRGSPGRSATSLMSDGLAGASMCSGQAQADGKDS